MAIRTLFDALHLNVYSPLRLLKTSVLLMHIAISGCQYSENYVPIYIDAITFEKTIAHKSALAIEDDDNKKLERYLRENPDLVAVADTFFGRTLLGFAINQENVEAVDILLRKNSDILHKDKNGKTMLEYNFGNHSRINRDLDDLIFQYVRENRSKYDEIELKEALSKSLVRQTVMKFDEYKLETLLELGADLDYRMPNEFQHRDSVSYDNSGCALTSASIQKQCETISWLLRNGADSAKGHFTTSKGKIIYYHELVPNCN